MHVWMIGSFLFFTALVGLLTWWITHKDDHASSQGFFLAGRSLTFPIIAGSLLLTNLSTEQMVGLNGAAFTDGLAVMVWEVLAVIGLVCMALFFLPRFLKSGITTVPQYVEVRYDRQVALITNIIFLVAYVCILLPIILYTGATGMIGILNVQDLFGFESHEQALWIIVWVVGLIGSVYALWGGLRTVAISDCFNGVGLLAGGFLITWFGLSALGGGEGALAGWSSLRELAPEKLNSIGGADTSVPVSTIFTGILLLNMFYWCTNQQIIQRTFGAKNLAEGQKGVLLTAALKLLGPMYLVLPGMIAFVLFAGQGIRADHAYGRLVNEVLPVPLAGFFAAAMLGAVLSSFNSALNSACTLFSIGLYQPILKPEATDGAAVRAGKWFGLLIAIAAMCVAPLLARTESIYGYLQKMNGMYFIPILAVIVVGMLSPRVPARAAKWALGMGLIIIATGYFIAPFDGIVAQMHDFHFLGVVFAYLVVFMLVMGHIHPRTAEFVQVDVKAVDLTPWRHAGVASVVLIALVLAIYSLFADFSVLNL
jgi:solute:Na+ symporter, SSS family